MEDFMTHSGVAAIMAVTMEAHMEAGVVDTGVMDITTGLTTEEVVQTEDLVFLVEDIMEITVLH
jgi:hypothetical protein